MGKAGKLLLGMCLGLAVLTGAGCVVRPAAVVVAPRCAGEVWVPPHYGPGGFYHAGHWRCANGAIYYR